MFIGHFAPAFIAAAANQRAPKLGILFIAAQLVDWVFFTLAIVGVETMRIDPAASAMVPFDLTYLPYSHSLLACGLWAIGFALIVGRWHYSVSAGLLAGLVVLSHWLLDFVVHPPDLTLAGGAKTYGLGLWDYPFAAIPLEIAITLAAFIFYIRRTKGPVGPPLILISALIAAQIYQWFGPVPEAADLPFFLTALAAFGILTLLAVWVGENRNFVRRGGLALGGT